MTNSCMSGGSRKKGGMGSVVSIEVSHWTQPRRLISSFPSQKGQRETSFLTGFPLIVSDD